MEEDKIVELREYEGSDDIRENGDGNWLIKELWKEMEDNGEMLEIIKMLKNINRSVDVKVEDGEGSKMKKMKVVK